MNMLEAVELLVEFCGEGVAEGLERCLFDMVRRHDRQRFGDGLTEAIWWRDYNDEGHQRWICDGIIYDGVQQALHFGLVSSH